MKVITRRWMMLGVPVAPRSCGHFANEKCGISAIFDLKLKDSRVLMTLGWEEKGRRTQ